jgi:5-methylcytosine-specific restriction endonuclease McrA
MGFTGCALFMASCEPVTVDIRENHLKLLSVNTYTPYRQPNTRETYAMIRLQIINLFPKQYCPEVFTQEFNHIHGIRKSRPISAESTLSVLN